jgi:hypothetical protein
MRFIRKSRVRYIVPMVLLGFALSGCANGGNGRSVALLPTATPTPNATVAVGPTPTPTPFPIANTSLQSYLPFHVGNAWIFSDGSRILDAGSTALQCACVLAGEQVEVMDFFGPSSNFLWAELFEKETLPAGSGSQTGHRITYLIGTSNAPNGGATVDLALAYPGATPGIFVMDDLPARGEASAYSSGIQNAAQTTITGVGGVITLANSQVQNVAVVQITGLFTQFQYMFALGVGFAALPGSNGPAPALVSFSVSPLSTT